MNLIFKEVKETLQINNSVIKLSVSVYEVKDGDFFVFIAPALSVSGYGNTGEEARQSFIDNIDFFCEALALLTTEQREIELTKLGFINENHQNTNYSNAYIDQNGVLQGLDLETLKVSRIEVTI